MRTLYFEKSKNLNQQKKIILVISFYTVTNIWKAKMLNIYQKHSNVLKKFSMIEVVCDITIKTRTFFYYYKTIIYFYSSQRFYREKIIAFVKFKLTPKNNVHSATLSI